MSWLSESVRSVVHGESKAERRARRAKEAEEAKLKAIGPAPKGDSLESQIASRTETPEAVSYTHLTLPTLYSV